LTDKKTSKKGIFDKEAGLTHGLTDKETQNKTSLAGK
jgi:hypothetical protein